MTFTTGARSSLGENLMQRTHQIHQIVQYFQKIPSFVFFRKPKDFR